MKCQKQNSKYDCQETQCNARVHRQQREISDVNTKFTNETEIIKKQMEILEMKSLLNEINNG